MKLSEKIAETKQLEGEMTRLESLRDKVVTQTPNLEFGKEAKTSDIEKKKKQMLLEKKKRYNELNTKIDALRQKVVEGRNVINKKNIQIGLDKKLVELKYLRIELSKLMKLSTDNSYFSRAFGMDVEDMGIPERIKSLEAKKNKLDSEIQQTNWSAEL